jgi:protein-S-isoprenylcysteine O-methyltransferase Ste14
MLKIQLRLIADTILVAAALFLSAGTLQWDSAWVLVATLFLVRSLSAFAAFATNPALLAERAGPPLHPNQQLRDKALVLAVLGLGFIGVPFIAGIDRFHWQLLPRPPLAAAVSGLALFVAGWAIKGWALRTNPFATSTVRIQGEKAQAVVDRGPYAIVRHPFYAADPLILVGAGLWLGSYAAVLFAIVPVLLMIVRLMLEERVLLKSLPGYDQYTKRVQRRLIPGIW